MDKAILREATSGNFRVRRSVVGRSIMCATLWGRIAIQSVSRSRPVILNDEIKASSIERQPFIPGDVLAFSICHVNLLLEAAFNLASMLANNLFNILRKLWIIRLPSVHATDPPRDKFQQQRCSANQMPGQSQIAHNQVISIHLNKMPGLLQQEWFRIQTSRFPLFLLLQNSLSGAVQNAIKTTQHRERKNDLPILRLLVITSQKVSDRSAEGRKIRLIHSAFRCR